MADHLTLLEIELDQLYSDRRELIATATFVPSWDDYNFRAGYLQAIREIGAAIKKIRNPETANETGEIPSVMEEV